MGGGGVDLRGGEVVRLGVAVGGAAIAEEGLGGLVEPGFAVWVAR